MKRAIAGLLVAFQFLFLALGYLDIRRHIARLEHPPMLVLRGTHCPHGTTFFLGSFFKEGVTCSEIHGHVQSPARPESD